MTRNPIEAYGACGPDREQRRQLIEEYLPLVHHVIGRLALHLPVTLDRDDLFEVGVLGLINAADSYNPAKGASFKTYAYVNIRGAILDEIRKHDVVPRSRRDRMRLVGETEARLEDRLGRQATPEEIAEEAELTVDQVEDALVHAHGAAVVSLDEPTSGSEDAGGRLVECLRMPDSPEPSNEAERNELKVALTEAIQELPERERHVILLYYAEELRLKEIGAVLGVTESRVSQLHARAIFRLNKSLCGEKPTTT